MASSVTKSRAVISHPSGPDGAILPALSREKNFPESQMITYGGPKGSNTNQLTKTQINFPKHKSVYQNTNQLTKTQNNFLKHKPIFQNTNQFTKTQINFAKHKPISRNTNQKTGHLLGHYQRAWKGLILRIFCILVPIALFSSLSRRGLGTRIEGLWGHRIFELI